MNGSASVSANNSRPSSSISNHQSTSSKQQAKSLTSAKTLDGARKQAASPVNTSSSSSRKPPQAWASGTNPITQRSTSSSPMANGITNGYAKPHDMDENAREGHAESNTAEKHAHDRALFLFANCTGLDVTVTLKSGERFSGVFAGVTTDSNDSQYILKMVRRTSHASGQGNSDSDTLNELLGEGHEHTMSFHVQDCQLDVASVDFSAAANKLANGSSFRTDTEISGNLSFRERELQRWQPGNDTDLDLSLAGAESARPGTWDQFAANESRFGLQSDYDENLYTTSINRSDPRYLERQQRAERLAREIEQDGDARRLGSDADAGLDEEDKYSGVRRDTPSLTKRGPNAYVPPSQRAATASTTPTTAPVDPAIISSQVARTSAEAPTGTESDNMAKSSTLLSSEGPIITGPSLVDVPKPGQEASEVTSAAPDASSTAAQEPKDNVFRNVHEAFKQFSNQEKLRSQERVRAVQLQKSSNARQEKSVKLNDLKKFSQNFKLHSRVPEDLVPILAKSKDKQDEIRDKADLQAREKEKKEKDKVASPPPSKPLSSRATPTVPTEPATDAASPTASRSRPAQPLKQPTTPSQPVPRGPGFSQRVAQNQAFRAASNLPPPLPLQSMQQPSSGPADSRVTSPTSAAAMRFNVKAMEFKPNPSASTFTPGAPSTTDTPGSKRPSVSTSAAPKAGTVSAGDFFSSDRKPSKMAEAAVEDVLNTSFNAIKRMMNEIDEQKKTTFAANGGIPQAYRTPPTWDASKENQERSYKDFFPKIAVNPQLSPLPGQPNGAMPHQHQLPAQLQHVGQGQHPQRFYAAGGPHMAPHMDDGRPPYSSSNSSVQPSPRMGHPAMAYQGQMHPQMSGYHYGMPAANGMSPGMSMRPMPGAQYMGPQGGAPMGGQMMVQQASNGPYANSPGPQHSMPMYSSPGPSHAQPHFGGHGGQQGIPGGYMNSPRGHPMSHQGSQQGHAPHGMYMMPAQGGQQMMMPQHGGPMTPMRGYAQPQFGGQHPQHGYAMQHRAMSGGGGGGYNQMTPRQQHAIPQGPGMGPMAGQMMPSHSSQGGDDGR